MAPTLSEDLTEITSFSLFCCNFKNSFFLLSAHQMWIFFPLKFELQTVFLGEKGLPWKLSGKESACQCRLGLEDPLEKEMATHSSILAWETPWTEEPGRLHSMGSQESNMTQRPNSKQQPR